MCLALQPLSVVGAFYYPQVLRSFPFSFFPVPKNPRAVLVYSYSPFEHVITSGNPVVTGYVSEAPPYNVNSSSFVLGSPNSSLATSSISTTSPSATLGLQTIRHDGPSHIDLDTLAVAFRDSSEYSKPDIKAFLLGAGMAVELIGELPRILSNAEYHSCFICYGCPDYDFARKLVEDLRAKGVSTVVRVQIPRRPLQTNPARRALLAKLTYLLIGDSIRKHINRESQIKNQ